MSLSLSAEQKDLSDIFPENISYVIPAFQRPYAWTDEQLMQLYYDVVEAFKRKEDYFLGVIVFAKNHERKKVSEIIDGQQRMTSLWLMLKVLSVLVGKPRAKERLERMLMVESWDDEDEFVPKLQWVSKIGDQNGQLKTVAEWSVEDFEGKDGNGAIIANARKMYHYLSNYLRQIPEEEVADFRDYLIHSVYLLPIEMNGESTSDAVNKALTIFETINNRGLDLADADIFKAKLFSMAKDQAEQELMEARWSDMVTRCEEERVTVDDLFRLYSHISRGRAGVTINEKRLRDFFTSDENSPFKKLTHFEIMDELERILDSLTLIRNLSQKETRLAAWLQVLAAYTNRYPWFALVTYVFKHLDTPEEELTDEMSEFLQSLLRAAYSMGATTAIKFRMFSIIASIMTGTPMPETYSVGFPSWIIESPGLAKAGLRLLYFYLSHPDQVKIPRLQTDRIFKELDRVEVNELIGSGAYEFLSETLVNTIAIDFPKRSLPYAKRQERVLDSEYEAIRKQLPAEGLPSMEFFSARRREIVETFQRFFIRN